MENENTNEKKQKVTILIGVVTSLIALLGATYAYFQISTDNKSSNTTITGKTPPKSLVTLIPGTHNLHLNISASDMSYENRTKEYYGTDVEDKSYEENESDGTKTIASVELTGGEETTKYSCTAKLTVSKVTEPTDEADTMIDVLQPGDMILQFKGNIISEKLDLSELQETGSKEYDLSFKIGNATKDIQAYIKLINKYEPQNDLSGKKLNIDISTSDLQCNVYIEHPKITQLRVKDSQGYLSEDLQGGMYRYQAAFPDSDSSEMTNWILFGTTENCVKDEEEKCTNITDSEGNNITYADYVDKYMYRIIGITEEGQMYLIKETFLKEGETTNTFQWNSISSISDCLGDACEWPNSDLYKRLNGETSNGNPILVNNSYYEYMVKNSEWYNLIADHNWMYGDTNETLDLNMFNGNYMYAIETGKKVTKRYWPDEETQTTCSYSSLCTEKEYTWSKNTNATKIGLMYVYDVDYAYPGGNPGNNENNKNNWIFFQKDGYNTSSDFEWLSTRRGSRASNQPNVDGRYVVSNGLLVGYNTLEARNGVRPVFYLSPNAKIKSGNGTKSDPYILDVQE